MSTEDGTPSELMHGAGRTERSLDARRLTVRLRVKLSGRGTGSDPATRQGQPGQIGGEPLSQRNICLGMLSWNAGARDFALLPSTATGWRLGASGSDGTQLKQLLGSRANTGDSKGSVG